MLEDFTSDYDTLLTNANTDTILISRLKLVAMEVYKCINAINVPYLNDIVVTEAFYSQDNCKNVRMCYHEHLLSG